MGSSAVLTRIAGTQADAGDTAALSDQDRVLLQDVDRALSDAAQLRKWWEQKDKTGDYATCFELVRTFNAPDRGIGFFDTAPVSNGYIPVMGVIQEMCFDQPKHTQPDQFREEFREFLLRYFTRVSSFREPEASLANPGVKLPPGLGFLSWLPEDLDTRVGFGYSQLFFKVKGNGAIRKIPQANRFSIYDLREIGQKYEWVVMKVQVFNFNLVFRPLGPNGVSLTLPLQEQTHIVMSPEFVTCREDDNRDVVAKYGFGYALMKYGPESGILAYGPGHFGAGFQLVEFEFCRNGEVRVRMVFVVNRPQRILRFNLDPVGWSFKVADLFSLGTASRLLSPWKHALSQVPLRIPDFDPVTAYISLANGLTGGAAARQLGISLEELEKGMLVQHFMEHYRMVVGSLLTWRQIPDWRETAALPPWAFAGLGR